jgi:RNase P subunit RPR2
METKEERRKRKNRENQARFQAAHPRYNCEVQARWRAKHPEEWRRRMLISMKKYRQKLRKQVFSILGERCNMCGFFHPFAMQIDHIRGHGAQDRRRRTPDDISRFIVSNPEEAKKEFQLLCANCNQIKRLSTKQERGGVGRKRNEQ